MMSKMKGYAGNAKYAEDIKDTYSSNNIITMEYQLIDGKATATAIKQEIAKEVKAIVAEGGKQPHLAAVLVGHDGGSETYVKNKVIACEQCGFKSTLISF